MVNSRYPGYLDSYPDGDSNSVEFHGNLDTTALGSAGFASQRTVDELEWDLTDYQGLSVKVIGGDAKKYTISIKDHILPKRPDGRERSTISWEYDFEGSASEVIIPWHKFKPTYRGKPKTDTDPLDLSSIKRLSIMCRRSVVPLPPNPPLTSLYLPAANIHIPGTTTAFSTSSRDLSALSWSTSPLLHPEAPPCF